jgi:hypothetical protein
VTIASSFILPPQQGHVKTARSLTSR